MHEHAIENIKNGRQLTTLNKQGTSKDPWKKAAPGTFRDTGKAMSNTCLLVYECTCM